MLTSPDEAHAYILELVRTRFGVFRDDGDTIYFSYREGIIPLGGYIELSAQLQAVLVRISTKVPVEPAYRAAAMEYVTRLNYQLPVGNWALDLDSGELRWKCGFYFSQSGIVPDYIDELLEASVSLVASHINGVVKVTVGGSVEEALEADKPKLDKSNAD